MELDGAIEIAARVVGFAVGVALVIRAVSSAVQTFVLPRDASDRLTRGVFLFVRWIFDLALRRTRTYAQRDQIMALYAPTALLMLPLVWLTVVLLGYMCLFRVAGVESWRAAFVISGSSLLTLGFAPVSGVLQIAMAFSEAVIGLTLVALLISYLPTMYGAFARRELAVTLLEVRAGSPPSAINMIVRFHRLHRLESVGSLWPAWEEWFAEIEESHTSLAALAFFRSPQPNRSWVTAAGVILDAAALTLSTVAIPHEPSADLCLRAGYLALRHVAGFFKIEYDPDPAPDDPISITRAEFDAAYDLLAEEGVPLRSDRDRAWRNFAGWRVNYDTVLLALASLTMAPVAHWSADRAPARSVLPFLHREW